MEKANKPQRLRILIMASLKPAGSWWSTLFYSVLVSLIFPSHRTGRDVNTEVTRWIFPEKCAWLFTDICTSLKCRPATECLGKLRYLLCVGDAKSAWRTCARSLEMPGTGPILILNSQFLQGHYFREVEV